MTVFTVYYGLLFDRHLKLRNDVQSHVSANAVKAVMGTSCTQCF